MKKAGLIFFIFLMTAGCSLFAQSKKDIKNNKIKSVKITNAKENNGEMTEKNESFTKYDKAGNEIEEVNYLETGEFKSRIERTFNKNNDVTLEEHFDKNDKMVKQVKTKYNVN